MLHLRTPLLALLLALPALLSAPSLAGSVECDAAQDRLRDALDESGHALTPAVAHALKAAVESCRADAAPAPLVTGHVNDAGEPADLRLPRGPTADACGFSSPQRAHQADGLIIVTTQHLLEEPPQEERGPSDVFYDPQANLTVYSARGPEHGLMSDSRGAGTLILHNVTIPADPPSQALSGCRHVGGELCWGQGYVRVTVPPNSGTLLTVSARGELNAC